MISTRGTICFRKRKNATYTCGIPYLCGCFEAGQHGFRALVRVGVAVGRRGVYEDDVNVLVRHVVPRHL